MQKKRVIIIGTGRSGTAYTSKLLRECGIDVGHEALGKDGVSSWYLTTDFEAFDGLDWADIESEPVLVGQQIRHPLKTIPSLMTFNKRSQDFIRRSGVHDVKPKSRIHEAMLHWYYWNRMAFDRADFHWTLEGLNPEILPILNGAGYAVNPDDLGQGMDQLFEVVNSSKTRVLSLKRAINTSPLVYLRRVRQAYFPMDPTWEDLRHVDRQLADDIERFYREYKASVRFRQGLDALDAETIQREKKNVEGDYVREASTSM